MFFFLEWGKWNHRYSASIQNEWVMRAGSNLSLSFWSTWRLFCVADCHDRLDFLVLPAICILFTMWLCSFCHQRDKTIEFSLACDFSMTNRIWSCTNTIAQRTCSDSLAEGWEMWNRARAASNPIRGYPRLVNSQPIPNAWMSWVERLKDLPRCSSPKPLITDLEARQMLFFLKLRYFFGVHGFKAVFLWCVWDRTNRSIYWVFTMQQILM